MFKQTAGDILAIGMIVLFVFFAYRQCAIQTPQNPPPVAAKDSSNYKPGKADTVIVYKTVHDTVYKKKAEIHYKIDTAKHDTIKISSADITDSIASIHIDYYHPPVDSFFVLVKPKGLEKVITKIDTVFNFKTITKIVKVPQLFYKDQWFWFSAVFTAVILALKYL